MLMIWWFFSKGKIDGLHALKDLFKRYALDSGQVINNGKSTIFSTSITLLDFKIVSLIFYYLGVPIFKGKLKACYLQPIVDKIKLKLSNWKGSLLSMACRVQLVRSVIQFMLIYIISIYS